MSSDGGGRTKATDAPIKYMPAEAMRIVDRTSLGERLPYREVVEHVIGDE